jgi:citrate lyase beta subunit
MFEKAFASDVDAIILDLEDAVVPIRVLDPERRAA